MSVLDASTRQLHMRLRLQHQQKQMTDGQPVKSPRQQANFEEWHAAFHDKSKTPREQENVIMLEGSRMRLTIDPRQFIQKTLILVVLYACDDIGPQSIHCTELFHIGIQTVYSTLHCTVYEVWHFVCIFQIVSSSLCGDEMFLGWIVCFVTRLPRRFNLRAIKPLIFLWNVLYLNLKQCSSVC